MCLPQNRVLLNEDIERKEQKTTSTSGQRIVS